MARTVMLPRIEAASVVSVIIEEVQDDFILAAKLKKTLVHSNLAKNHYVVDFMDGKIPFLLTVIEHNCIALATNLAIGVQKHSSYSHHLLPPYIPVKHIDPLTAA
jgi:hypothetical protein